MPRLIFIDGDGISRVYEVPSGVTGFDFLEENELPEDYGNLILTQHGWELLKDKTDRAIGSLVDILA